MKTYKHIIFDLDDTIWDFSHNSKLAIHDVFNDFGMQKYCTDFDLFLEKYHFHNDLLWAKYRKGEIDKQTLSTTRFHVTMLEFGYDDFELAKKMNNHYLSQTTLKTTLKPHAHETLQNLSARYPLHILTNGFNEVQYKKLDNSKLSSYFTKIITSEAAGALKPSKKIFNYTLSAINANPAECIMIGDHFEIDILGAKEAGIDQIFYNPGYEQFSENATFEINSLNQLTEIL